MATLINLEPPMLDLRLYAGDGFSMKFTLTNSAGAPIDITGTVTAEIRSSRLDVTESAEFDVNMVDAYLGIFHISLTGVQTQSLINPVAPAEGKFTGVWDVQWNPAEGEPRTLAQGKVECVADVTR